MEAQQQTTQQVLRSIKKNKSKDLQTIANRVNYILRRQKKAIDQFNSTKLQACTTQASENNKFSINFPHQFGSSHRSIQGQRTSHFKPMNELNQQSKVRNVSVENSILELSLLKQRNYIQRKHQIESHQKLIQKHKQCEIACNRAKKLKVIKSQRVGKEQLNQFWETKRLTQKTFRDTKKIPDKMCEMKLEDLKIRILQAEEESLNRLQQLICQQEQVANRIKTKLKIL